MRSKLQGKDGAQYWRSLEELAGTDEFQRFVDDEFPHRATLLELDRRQFLTLMGSSLALAGLTGCRILPQDKIVPYVKAPEEVIAGKPLTYATAISLGGYAHGVLVESHEGRPTKIEGNPGHPASLGATNAFMQAAMHTLYDPDRARAITNVAVASTWDDFLAATSKALEGQTASKGAGIRLLTETVTSPTLAAQIREFLTKYPNAEWHQYDTSSADNVKAGARLALGSPVNVVYKFDKAARVLSLDSDFLMTMPGSVRYARDFTNGRRVRKGTREINRLYAIESMPTLTGALADHRLPAKSSDIEAIAYSIAQGLGIDVGSSAPTTKLAPPWIAAAVKDLNAHPGESLVVPGEQQPPSVHALCHAINEKLGAVGKTVVYTEPVEAEAVEHVASLNDLLADIHAGHVQALFILGGSNPAFTAPADFAFADTLRRVRFKVYHGIYADETAALCDWHVPDTHFLEAWSDARAFDGTASIVQPLIEPLYVSKSAHEVMAALNDKPLPGYDILRESWKALGGAGDFDTWWRKTLYQGFVDGSAAKEVQATIQGSLASRLPQPVSAGSGLEINFRLDPTLGDGRWANNAWLQELPKPVTKLVWDNAAIMSPATATELKLCPADRPDQATGSMVELSLGNRKLKMPVYILPGHAANSVTVHVGYGRTKTGLVGADHGFNPYPLRTSAAPWFSGGLKVSPTGEKYDLLSTHYHNSIEMLDRELARVRTIEDFIKNPKLTEPDEEENPPEYDTLFREPDTYRDWEGAKWGMSIDLQTCIGCNACVVACQAENNIPTVGKDQVSRGREMHWIRIDRYFKGKDLENPQVVFQPVPCMHCERAPCEPVCPVAATTHSHEGLNQMVYNRCVGTRYCSNNCPYKVRRFNFLNYANHHDVNELGQEAAPLKLLNNPNVTVRSRGVMEKCSYCVQRINAARIEAKKDRRNIKDGEVVTACEQACPTQAIIFGDIADANSRVSKAKRQDHDYTLLADLNTRPRTTYMAKIRNPNPEISTE